MGFKYLNKDVDLFDADDGEDFYTSEEQLEARLEYFSNQLKKITKNSAAIDRIKILLEMARIQVSRHKGADAWKKAMSAFDLAIENKLWELATECCDVMFLSEGPESLKALGHAIWLGVSFPIDAEITVAMLHHLVEESPKEADTRAVAAATALYISSIRCNENDDVTFFATQMLTNVADEHSNVTEQRAFDLWRKTLNLDNPEIFLPQLSGALEQLTNGEWWFDKNKLRENFQSEN